MPKTKKTRRSQSSIPWPVILIGLGVLVLLGVLVAAGLQGRNLGGAGVGGANNAIPFPNIERVSIQDARQAVDAGEAILVDVRDASAYDQSHIAGAVSIPERDLGARLGELDQNRWIITYCT